MSYATIVSICPTEIHQSLPHTTPAHVHVPAGSLESPSLTVLSDGIERRYIGKAADEKNPWASYPVTSLDLAKAITSQYKISATYVEPGAYPGVFVIEGKPSFVDAFPAGNVIYIQDDPKTLEFAKNDENFAEFKRIETEQNNWFRKLIAVADKSFAKSNNPAEISTLQRHAAKVFNLDRPWAKEVRPEDFQKCPFCATFLDPVAVVCKECHQIVNPDKYKELNAWKENESGNVLSKLG